MKRISLAVGAVLAVLALSGFTSAGTTAVDAAPNAATDDATLGPDGYKGLHLGQSEADAEATGLLVDKQVDGDCTRYYLAASEGQQNPGSGVWVDKQLGVVLIGGTTLSHTPENVTIGTELAAVQSAYPDLTQLPAPQDFVYATPVPGHPDLTYRFAVDESDLVADFVITGPDGGSCVAA